MANNGKNKGLWAWIILGLVVSAIVLGVICYIGWFNTNTHVDSRESDVLEDYTVTDANADAPGEADWQNDEHQSFQEIITEPASETQTPPSGE